MLAPIVTYRIFRKGPLVADNPTVAILVAPFSLTQLAWFACFSAGLQESWHLEHMFYVGSLIFLVLTIVALVVRKDSALTQMAPAHERLFLLMIVLSVTSRPAEHLLHSKS